MLIVLLLVVAATGASGCGGDSGAPAPEPTDFELALEHVGEGISPAGAGYGWIDLAASPEDADVAIALGPGPADFIAEPRLLRAAGVEMDDATAATSVAASYGYSVRLDGADGSELERLLRAEGRQGNAGRRVDGYDLGNEWERPLDGPLVPLRDYATRTAIGPDGVILSRTDAGREALEDEGDSPLTDPYQAFAAECLGDVSSARTLLANHTHNPFASPDLIAAGVRSEPPGEEVLCTLGEDTAAVDGWEQGLRRAFAAGAREPITGEPIAERIAGATVDQVSSGDLHAARAVLEPAPGSPPGYLFGAMVSGSVLPFVGAEKPIPEGTQTSLEGEGG